MIRIAPLAVAVVLCLTFPAFAAPVDLAAALVGQDGKPLIECIAVSVDRTKCEQEIPITVGFLCRLALDFPEEKIAAAEIVKRGSLSEKIRAKDQIEFSVDEAKLIKDQLVRLPYRTFTKFQVIKMIDPKSVDDAK